mmetsp:Transcript_26909/g.77993  ORF Transcript_26909/g.77993 Transcript_26909/m.77993 type:complete len:233 (-) Transcript_26909:319-1017(-)
MSGLGIRDEFRVVGHLGRQCIDLVLSLLFGQAPCPVLFHEIRQRLLRLRQHVVLGLLQVVVCLLRGGLFGLGLLQIGRESCIQSSQRFDDAVASAGILHLESSLAIQLPPILLRNVGTRQAFQCTSVLGRERAPAELQRLLQLPPHSERSQSGARPAGGGGVVFQHLDCSVKSGDGFFHFLDSGLVILVFAVTQALRGLEILLEASDLLLQIRLLGREGDLASLDVCDVRLQ